MGRIRTIKPEILMDRKAAQLSHAAWRLWVSCWVIADDCGRLPADPAFLAGQVFWAFPNAFDETSRALASLRESSMVDIYEVNGEQFMQIRGWRKHQKIDRPSGPKFPGPDDGLSAQTSLPLASPREPSRDLDPDHDRDHDRDRDHEHEGAPDKPAAPRATRPDPEKGKPALRVVSGGAAEPTPEPAIVQPAANGEATEATGKRKREAPPVPDQAVTLAHLLLGMIIANHPTARISKQTEAQQDATALRWAQTIDKLHRLDGFTWAEIEGMITWCQRDQFWRGVILGADNLRDKWDKLAAQRDRRGGAATRTRPPLPDQSFDDVLEEAAREVEQRKEQSV